MITTTCPCGNEVVAPRRLFCSEKCSKKARQKRWRDTHPEYRSVEDRSHVYIGVELVHRLEQWAQDNGKTRTQAARELITHGLEVF